MLDNILSLLPIILAVVVVLAIILTGYVKAPPDQAYIISGLKKESKVLIGRAG
ncbi:MAG: flotillin family protein, partial [Oscillibacter sp.]|nr:flotillin family protein [Oscillibacter sp.]MCI9241253.1 flotillin family protein [Oscillibacter sp.]